MRFLFLLLTATLLLAGCVPYPKYRGNDGGDLCYEFLIKFQPAQLVKGIPEEAKGYITNCVINMERRGYVNHTYDNRR